jgi:hypothetical protein
MSGLTFAEFAAGAALLLNVSIAIVGATWGLAKIKEAVRDLMEMHRKEVDQELSMLGRNFGETAAALRQKVSDVEIWGRDNYVRRDDFLVATGEIKAGIALLGERLENRFERMESKIDGRDV